MILTSKEKSKYRATKHFKNLRLNKLEECKYRCKFCSVKKPKCYLQLHHIDPTKYADENEALYTVILCPECHKFIENKIKVLNNPKNPETEEKKKLRELLKPYSILIT